MSKRVNIVLLVCDQFPGILTPDIPSYEWMFEKVFDEASKLSGIAVGYQVFQAWRGELPANPDADDLYLITGSNNSAYDDVPWVANLRDWIKYAYKGGCRIAGICFGHQILSEALGGKVERSPKGWGIGIRTSRIVDDDFKAVAGAGSFSVLYDHHDQVVALPKGAVLVSESDFCPIESFRIGWQVLALQGHPEFSNTFIRHWINDCAPDEPESVKLRALNSIDTLDNEGVAVASWILKAFS